MSKSKTYRLVNCYISRDDEDNPVFIKLRNYLLENEVALETSLHKTPNLFEIANCTLLIISANIKQITFLPPSELVNHVLEIQKKPLIEKDIVIKYRNSVQSTSISENQTLIAIKLNASDSKLEIDYSHTYYDLEDNFELYKKAILKQIINSGTLILKEYSAPAKVELEDRFRKKRLELKDFPVFPNGKKLLPGSEIRGDRDFYYDCDGVLLDLTKIANSGDIYQDWKVLCGFYAFEFGGWVEVEGLLDWVTIVSFASPLIENILPAKSYVTQIKPIIKNIDSEILEYISKNPKFLSNLNPESFENVIYKIYESNGFNVEKVGNWNQGDDGVDIIAIKKDLSIGTIKLAIQCKSSKNTIRPSVIRELNGVLDRYNANFGVIATTSTFSSKSENDVENFYWKIKLEDRNQIINKLKKIFENK